MSSCPLGLRLESNRCREVFAGTPLYNGDASWCGTGGAGSAVCAPAEVCSLGACTAVCAPGYTQCGRDCANLRINPRHCGTCGNGCGPGEACVEGRCRP